MKYIAQTLFDATSISTANTSGTSEIFDIGEVAAVWLQCSATGTDSTTDISIQLQVSNHGLNVPSASTTWINQDSAATYNTTNFFMKSIVGAQKARVLVTRNSGAAVLTIRAVGKPVYLPASSTTFVSLTGFGSSPNSAGATLAAGVFNLEYADATHPGGVSTGTQVFGGNKTFNGTTTIGVAAGALNHVINGNQLNCTGSTSTSVFSISRNATAGVLNVNGGGAGGGSGGEMYMYGASHASFANYIKFFTAGTLAGDINASQNVNFYGSVTIAKNLISGPGGNNTAVLKADGVLYRGAPATVVNSAGGETTLWTYTLPVNVLNTNGDALKVSSYGAFAANGNAKTIKLYFGAQTITVASAVTTNNKTWAFEFHLIRLSSSTMRYCGWYTFDGNAPTLFDSTLSTLDYTATNVVKITGQATADSDLNAKFMAVRFEPAA